MPIRRQLETLLQRLPDAQGAILADWEGESIESSSRIDEYELKVTGAHIGIILTQLRQAVERISGDPGLQELVITTRQRHVLVMPLSEDYFLVLVAGRNCLPGRARFELRRCAEALKPEIF